ncbi:MAG TPA: hypothetical protein VEX13_09805 [Chloroflexia bacterium]|nr:hypothetical protein [Chloroflexia bacterium]
MIKPLRRSSLVLWAFLLALMALAGCQSSPAASQPDSSGKSSTPLPNPPAVVEPTATLLPLDTPTQISKAAWAISTDMAGGVKYSFRYPSATWTADLTYCGPEAQDDAKDARSGFGIPAGCAVTDLLVGQKVQDVGQVTGERLTINGKRAVRHIESNPPSGMASRIYTVLVYDADGTPLFGFSTSLGPGTHVEAQEKITSTLNEIAGTITVEKQP